MNISYLITRMAKMDYKAFADKLNSIQKKTGKNKLYLLLDMLNCAAKYGAGYMDYDLFEMYDLTPAQRNTYITRGRNNALVKKYNDTGFAHFFDNKAEFNILFSDFIKREWITINDNKERVLDFIRNRDAVVAKPLEGSCGKDVEIIEKSDYPNPQAIYDKLFNSGNPFLLEEVIDQHPQVSMIYPKAVNTVRAVTIYHEGKARIVCTYFRIGNDPHCVDNFNSDGMVAPVDELTGVVKNYAIDKNKRVYAIHPYSGTPIKGFVFPYWKEAMDMVLRATKVVPSIGYVGWDIAFTPSGPCLVEGNCFPGHDIYQLPGHTLDKRGIYERFSI